MDDPLQDAKRRISGRYLGRGGIHGIGLRRSEQGIVVYLEPGAAAVEGPLLREIEREAAPFRLILVHEPPPRIS